MLAINWNSAKYNTPQQLQKKIDEYFNSSIDTRIYRAKDGEEIEVPSPTITGLSLFLGFASKQSFYDYEKKPLRNAADITEDYFG